MTQKSYPWPGVSPASGADAGRYTAPEWWGEWASEQLTSGVVVTSPLLRVATTFTNIGVHYSVGNRLAVTSSGNNKITVATGAWTNDGQFGYNDTEITDIAITSPAANPRIDRVVVRKNYTGNTYTPTNAASETVGPYTARITIISGTEAGAPVAPSLIQDTARNNVGVFGTDGTWDIPLAQYEISVGGVISNLTDEREWVDAETKRRFAPITSGRNTTDGTYASIQANGPGATFVYSAIQMDDNKITDAFAWYPVPQDFISDMVVKAIVVPLASGNFYGNNTANTGACGQSYAAHVDFNGASAIAVTQDQLNCIDELDVTNAAIGDMMLLKLSRIGNDALDTIGDEVHAVGFEIEYLGWKR
jgi:hypothetical protein